MDVFEMGALEIKNLTLGTYITIKNTHTHTHTKTLLSCTYTPRVLYLNISPNMIMLLFSNVTHYTMSKIHVYHQLLIVCHQYLIALLKIKNFICHLFLHISIMVSFIPTVFYNLYFII